MAVFVEPDNDTLVEIFDGEAVLLSLRTEQFHALDRTATTLWSALEHHLTIDATAAAVAASHDVPVERVRRDLDRLVNDLAERGLLHVSDR